MSKPGWTSESGGVQAHTVALCSETPETRDSSNGLMLPQQEQLSPLALVAQVTSALRALSPADPHVLPSHTAGPLDAVPLAKAAAFTGTLLRLLEGEQLVRSEETRDSC